jgi:hypothetical protein
MDASPISPDLPCRQDFAAQLDIQGWRFFTGVRFNTPPHLHSTFKAPFDHTTTLENAKTYLSLAGFHPMGLGRKKKRAKKEPNPQTLLYTRGATAPGKLFLNPSPKNMRIDVTVSGVPVDDYQSTDVQIEYEVELPPGVGVARQSCDFWIEEMIGFQEAIRAENYDRTAVRSSATRATGYCLARNYGQSVVLLGIVILLVIWANPGVSFSPALGWVLAALAGIACLHIALVMQLGK